MPAPFRFDRRFEFAVAAPELWATVEQTDRYPEWFPWLRHLDGVALQEGSVAQCVIQGPIPYSLHLSVHIEQVMPGERIATRVRGDLEGPASLDVEPDGSRSTARLRWELEPHDRLLRSMATLARPAMVWAHDRVIEVGLREFERRALDGRGA